MKKPKGDRFLELSLYGFGLSLFFVYFFVTLSRWVEYPFLCIFCGFFFYISLLRVISKRNKKKFDYAVPLLCLIVSVPAGHGFDYIANALLYIFFELELQLALFQLIIIFCFGVGVIGTAVILLGLMFWEELFFNKRK